MARSRMLTVWLPVFAWAAVIFAFSSIPSLSSGLGEWDTVLRKGAHITEYAILGALLYRALGVEAGGQVRDGLLEPARDGSQVLLVASHEDRIGLGGEVVREVERTRGAGDHGIGSDLGTASGPASGGGPTGDSGAAPGPCRKPPGAI